MKNKLLIKTYGRRNKRLKRFGYKEYKDYLTSEEWKSVKRRLYERGIKKGYWNVCWVCGTKKNIQIHHARYNMIGKGSIGSSLYPLCKSCHYKTHQIALKDKKVGLKGAMKKVKKDRLTEKKI